MSSNRYALAAAKRERAGKGIARQLRREDRVPAVIYGDNKAPVLISLPEKELRLEHQKGHLFTNLCELNVDGETVLALARDVQVHAVTDKIETVDFLRVGPKTKTVVEVPVHLINQEQCPGVKNGGVLNIVAHTVELRCVVTDIPDFIELDLGQADVGDNLKLSDVKLPNGAEVAQKGKDFTIVSIVAPSEYTENEITAPTSDADVAAAAAAASGKPVPKGSAGKGPAPKGAAAAPAAAAKPAAKK